MKRTLLTALLGLGLAASAGACTCGGDETDATGGQGDGALQKPHEPAVADNKAAPAEGDAPAEVPGDDAPEEPPVVPGGDPLIVEGAEAEAEGAEAEGAEAEGAEAEGAEAEGAEGAEAEGAEAEAEGAEGEGEGDEEGNAEGIPVKDLDPFVPGDVYSGPSSKAIVGTWKISLPKSSIPKDLPKEERDKLKALADVTIDFDGKKMTVVTGEEKESFNYKVTEEKGITLQILASKGEQDDNISITFYDMDNILLNEPRFPGPARGARAKDE